MRYSKPFKVTMNSKGLGKMIESCRFACVGSEVTKKNFPIKEVDRHKITLRLIHFEFNDSIKELLATLKGYGFKPTRIEHLLEFVARYEIKQKKHPIIALGSVYRSESGKTYYPIVDFIELIDGWDMTLNLIPANNIIDSRQYRFLVIDENP